MGEPTEIERTIAKNYDHSQGPEKNAQRISRKTGINLTTCRCYITSLQRGLTFWEYLTRRKKKRRRFFPTEPDKVIEMYDERNSSAINETDEIERREIINNMINSLPQEERDILVSHFYEGKTYGQIARKKGLSKQQVYTRMKKILEGLRFSALKRGLQATL